MCVGDLSVPLTALLLVNNAVHGPGHLSVKGPGGNLTFFRCKKSTHLKTVHGCQRLSEGWKDDW